MRTKRSRTKRKQEDKIKTKPEKTNNKRKRKNLDSTPRLVRNARPDYILNAAWKTTKNAQRRPTSDGQ